MSYRILLPEKAKTEEVEAQPKPAEESAASGATSGALRTEQDSEGVEDHLESSSLVAAGETRVESASASGEVR